MGQGNIAGRRSAPEVEKACGRTPLIKRYPAAVPEDAVVVCAVAYASMPGCSRFTYQNAGILLTGAWSHPRPASSSLFPRVNNGMRKGGFAPAPRLGN